MQNFAAYKNTLSGEGMVTPVITSPALMSDGFSLYNFSVSMTLRPALLLCEVTCNLSPAAIYNGTISDCVLTNRFPTND